MNPEMCVDIAIWRESLQARSTRVSELWKTAHKQGARKRALLSHINVTAYSKVKLHILGKARWLTIFLNHL